MKIKLYVQELLRELVVFRSRIAVESWLDRSGIFNYTINEDLSVDVAGHVSLSSRSLTCIPVRFRNIAGNFNLFNNQLTSLVGCPIEVSGIFYCGKNKLTDLVGCPAVVSGNFDCSENELVSLKGFCCFRWHIIFVMFG